MDGKAILEREFQRLDIEKIDWGKLAPALNLRSSEDVYAAVGAGDLRVSQVLNAVQDELERTGAILNCCRLISGDPKSMKRRVRWRLMVSIICSPTLRVVAKPVPGDAVVGYIFWSRIYRAYAKQCMELQRLAESHPERLIDVIWSEKDRSGLPGRNLYQEPRPAWLVARYHQYSGQCPRQRHCSARNPIVRTAPLP